MFSLLSPITFFFFFLVKLIHSRCKKTLDNSNKQKICEVPISPLIPKSSQRARGHLAGGASAKPSLTSALGRSFQGIDRGLQTGVGGGFPVFRLQAGHRLRERQRLASRHTAGQGQGQSLVQPPLRLDS